MRQVLVSIVVCLVAISICYNSYISSSFTFLLHSTSFASLLSLIPSLQLPSSSTRFLTFFVHSPVTPLSRFPTKADNMSTPRAIHQTFLAIEQSEGAGARVRRSIGTAKLRNFSPFLMLDHFTVHPGAGFPDHPHRGQETITYLLKGAVDHEDFAGNAGTIEAGDLQFMTAGKGIMHAEMPRQNPDGSANVGMVRPFFQLGLESLLMDTF